MCQGLVSDAETVPSSAIIWVYSSPIHRANRHSHRLNSIFLAIAGIINVFKQMLVWNSLDTPAQSLVRRLSENIDRMHNAALPLK